MHGSTRQKADSDSSPQKRQSDKSSLPNQGNARSPVRPFGNGTFFWFVGGRTPWPNQILIARCTSISILYMIFHLSMIAQTAFSVNKILWIFWIIYTFFAYFLKNYAEWQKNRLMFGVGKVFMRELRFLKKHSLNYYI